MIGFTALTLACREVEGVDEARVDRDGVHAFEELFAEVGPRQADRARLQNRGSAG